MSLRDFVIVSKLGEGAYSSVYKVKRLADSQIYALKKVKMNNLKEKEQENALNQVRILASINHPNIIGYKQAFIDAQSLHIVMEFSDDGDLFQKIEQYRLNRSTFSQDFIWKVLLQVTIGLSKLHEMNIFHRDLKSANVFLSSDGTAKLGDMNVSKIAKEGLLYTQTGTPYYASPEVWRDQPYGSKSDIWSLGCVIYEMVTLKPPFRAHDMQGLYKKVTKGIYDRISNRFSLQLSQIIKSMLQVNPIYRPSAAQLIKTLSAKAEKLGINTAYNKQSDQLLQTIRPIPNCKLHYLTDRLPQSNYEGMKKKEEFKEKKAMSQSVSKKTKQQISNLSNNAKEGGNLPKLEKILMNINKSQKYPVRRLNHLSENPPIGIRGDGIKNPHLAYNRSPQKIYSNLEPQKKVSRRLIQLPRIK